MAEKMLTNWFAFLLHKFLKVRKVELSPCCYFADSPASHLQGESGLETPQSVLEAKDAVARQGRWKFLVMPVPGTAVRWAESSSHSLCAQPSSASHRLHGAILT